MQHLTKQTTLRIDWSGFGILDNSNLFVIVTLAIKLSSKYRTVNPDRVGVMATGGIKRKGDVGARDGGAGGAGGAGVAEVAELA